MLRLTVWSERYRRWEDVLLGRDTVTKVAPFHGTHLARHFAVIGHAVDAATIVYAGGEVYACRQTLDEIERRMSRGYVLKVDKGTRVSERWARRVQE